MHMGIQELVVRRRARKRNLQKIILATVAAAGFLALAAVAPNSLQALAKLGIIDVKKKGRAEKTIINRARDRLVHAGLLARNTQGFLQLTPKGEAKLRQLELRDYQLKKPRRWDRRWRVLIFDIPERKRLLRDRVRQTLVAIGFAQLQQSVWIYPYDCEDLIALLKADFGVGNNLLYLVVEEMENERAFREHFGFARR